MLLMFADSSEMMRVCIPIVDLHVDSAEKINL